MELNQANSAILVDYLDETEPQLSSQELTLFLTDLGFNDSEIAETLALNGALQ